MEELSPYWQQIAVELIENRHVDWNDIDAIAKWVGRASAVMAEALRVSGNCDGIDAIIGILGAPRA